MNPDDVIAERGRPMRLYEMFMGPLEMVKPWSMSGIHGVKRFLDRTWRLCSRDVLEGAPPESQLRSLHLCIKKVTDDTEGLRFNTAISALMILVNELTREENQYADIHREFMKLLNPYAPHIAEEMGYPVGWNRLLNRQSRLPLTRNEWKRIPSRSLFR